jgi:hypothetical protein
MTQPRFRLLGALHRAAETICFRAMKIAALLAGIALSLNVGVGLINFAMYLSRVGVSLVPGYLAGQGMWFFAQACMIAFFFTFYARVKE